MEATKNNKLRARLFTTSVGEAGVEKSKPYIESKWGIQMGNFKDKHKLDCKSITGLNELCETPYRIPFNQQSSNISHWELRQETADRIREAATHIPSIER